MPPLPLRAAKRLLLALDDLGVTADLHRDYRIALISVWVDLVVWTNGSYYSWWSGRISPHTGRKLCTYCPTDDPMAAARRVATRYARLRETQPLPTALAEPCAWSVLPV